MLSVVWMCLVVIVQIIQINFFEIHIHNPQSTMYMHVHAIKLIWSNNVRLPSLNMRTIGRLRYLKRNRNGSCPLARV